ncbi:ATP-dependent helicase [Leptospira borgpetersenii]|uniref:DNA 3'-5' helicase n=2 Tax=Leptospira borgpetersenii serovar Hardjo-bovis TaxID=338217 RepID=Q04T32_LEPBJ|nr:UvrD-helicase domain-containing protein [Leptospira borgpetersenii]ABJ75938.1 ATP-dependent DNA helicase [Leptospira borgpetersenii serovar Hardjo-bovis str. JB197]ABJ79041.1 ATP-dependent DNA helicase [Leptospira borgpetersenii serovar Hardjo-bovis str. L550]AMX58342.1 ATP-dependent DNA helicase [Leptospira borgpetersenii serovar Hardjo]AMX61595.1 ATP-dependent DNA helicase [Leptospira borgpetersenii serovar Hardjo]AMX64839.1 ATP-dependent DNA helicase [Leptospira borgpetersenii serovar Ha
MSWKEELNAAQLEAVLTQEGPVLVLAGAGTGKTKTIVSRLAQLVSSGVPTSSILLLTFTRKAAREMLLRASSIGDKRCTEVQGGTFHSFCSGVLRKFAPVLGLSSGFTILDESDTLDVFQFLRNEKDFGKTKSRFPSNETLISIYGEIQNTGRVLQTVLEKDYPLFLQRTKDISQIFEDYKSYKTERSLLDYDDLLYFTRDLLTNHPGVRNALSEKYKFIMVDEFQDTNKVQAHIACLLASEHSNLMVVGDDAQCIYTFRGASVRGILDFPKIFSNTKTIFLEKNYRSTTAILNLANAVLQNFSEKYDKYLFTDNENGSIPNVLQFEDELEEAEGIAEILLQKKEDGIPFKKMCVLFRAGWNSNQLELVLAKRNIPFVKFGGRKFIETAHIKDLLSFLKVLVNPLDSVSWIRVLKLIPGIGNSKANGILDKIRKSSGSFEVLLGENETAIDKYISPLYHLYQKHRETYSEVKKVTSDFIDYYRVLLEKNYDDSKRRSEDLDSVLGFSLKYTSLGDFLSDLTMDHASLSLDKIKPDDAETDLLNLSTVHSAKGLEFDLVFILNATEGVFPSSKNTDTEEERRLFYVAITRARKELYFTRPSLAHSRSGPYYTKLSRFLSEIQSPEKVYELKLIPGKSVPQNFFSTKVSSSKTANDSFSKIQDYFGN